MTTSLIFKGLELVSIVVSVYRELTITTNSNYNIEVVDASRKESAAIDVKRDLFDAMNQIAKTGQGPIEQIPSMGCSIKWY